MSKEIVWGQKQQKILNAPYSHCLEVNEGTPRSGKTTVSVSRFAWYLWNTPDLNHMVLGLPANAMTFSWSEDFTIAGTSPDAALRVDCFVRPMVNSPFLPLY